jgi:hypothetical protein
VRDRQEPAAWLLQVLFVVLVTETATVPAALLDARFKAGLDYLEAEFLFLHRLRNAAANYEQRDAGARPENGC